MHTRCYIPANKINLHDIVICWYRNQIDCLFEFIGNNVLLNIEEPEQVHN